MEKGPPSLKCHFQLLGRARLPRLCAVIFLRYAIEDPSATRASLRLAQTG